MFIRLSLLTLLPWAGPRRLHQRQDSAGNRVSCPRTHSTAAHVRAVFVFQLHYWVIRTRLPPLVGRGAGGAQGRSENSLLYCFGFTIGAEGHAVTPFNVFRSWRTRCTERVAHPFAIEAERSTPDRIHLFRASSFIPAMFGSAKWRGGR